MITKNNSALLHPYNVYTLLRLLTLRRVRYVASRCKSVFFDNGLMQLGQLKPFSVLYGFCSCEADFRRMFCLYIVTIIA